MCSLYRPCAPSSRQLNLFILRSFSARPSYLIPVSVMRYDDAMAKTMTEFEVLCEKLGWDPAKATRERFARVSAKRYPLTDERWKQLTESDAIYKRCDICGTPVNVNNWPDRKPRTPTIKDFVVCPNCDPRAVDDRYKKKGYRIMFRTRMRVIHFAMIVRAMKKYGCLKLDGKGDITIGCKCAGCAAAKMFPPPAPKPVDDEVIYGS